MLLEDGTRFDGELCAAPQAATGEVVFNTAMSGYQESVTDPSYRGQIIVFTYPLIGNYGVSARAMESDQVHARAVIMREAGGRAELAVEPRAVLEEEVAGRHRLRRLRSRTTAPGTPRDPRPPSCGPGR